VKKFVEACRRPGDNFPRVRQLIAEGADINGMYGDMTGLMGAILNNNREIMNTLLSCPDIDVNIRDRYGGTALYFAIYWGNIEAVRKLLSRGDTRIDIVYDMFGNTVLHRACHENKEELVAMVLGCPSCNKAFVNKKNANGRTAELIADERGCRGCVELIRKYLGNNDGQDEEDAARSVVKRTQGDFESMVVTFKETVTTRANQLRAEINRFENEVMKQLGEFELKSAADLAEIIKKMEDMKRGRAVVASPQTGSRSPQVPECPVCYERMIPPRQIYTCGNGHVICSDCKARMNEETGNNECINHCGARYTGRATTVEQMIGEIMGTE